MKYGQESKKREIYVVLALLLVLAIFLGISLLKPMPVSPSGTPHSEINGMRIGGDGAARFKGFETTAFVLFAASFILFSTLIVTSVSKRNRSASFWFWLVLITLLVLFVWYRVFDSYTDYLSTGDLRFFLGFPEPTAWMIFGLWGGGALFALLYVLGFRRFIYTKHDEETLKDIIEEYAKEGEER
jgi:hypothetical protein